MSDVSALVAPSVAWHPEYGYELAERTATTALEFGCRGVLLHGGPLDATRDLLARLRARAPQPMFAAADLTGGVGERFTGATALPPMSALDAADLEAMRRAARLTAREARAAGINWALAPFCAEPESLSPIKRSRAFSGNDEAVGDACSEWVDTCQAEGVVATPGPYPAMRASAAEAALDSGAAAMLIAPECATDRATIAYLRNSARFDGVIAARLDIVSELRDEDEDATAIACVAAGCDLLLGADDIRAVVQALRQAQTRNALHTEEVRASVARVDRRARWADIGDGTMREATLDDALWARRVADDAVHVQRGHPHALVNPVDVIIVDDDPPRIEPAGTALVETLQRLDVDVRRAGTPAPDSRGSVVIALIGDRRLSLGFDTFSDGALARVRDAFTRAERAARDVIVVHFTPPELASAFDGIGCVACAWSGTRAMEEAAARWLARGGS